LFKDLSRAWAKSHAKGLVHIFRDDEAEEKYHAIFMQEVMRAGGLDGKIIVNLDGLVWDSEGNILDADGEPLRWVWKTWAWETALDQIRTECEADEAKPGQVYESSWQKTAPI
jgi:glutathionylspermidine amidase/synthetase